ncbi:alanine:cation symporter family protein [Staphylococcus saprophyticus]
MAVDSILVGFGSKFLAIALFFFCFTTMITYYYKAETSLSYMIKNRLDKKNLFLFPLRIGILVCTFLGTIISASTAWAIGDIGLGSMAYLNLLSILFLTKIAMKVLKDYKKQLKNGKDPEFNPLKLGIKNADFWEERLEKERKNYITSKKY